MIEIGRLRRPTSRRHSLSGKLIQSFLELPGGRILNKGFSRGLRNLQPLWRISFLRLGALVSSKGERDGNEMGDKAKCGSHRSLPRSEAMYR